MIDKSHKSKTVAGLSGLIDNSLTLDDITLEQILTALVTRHGWDELQRRIDIRCFANDPSIKSSLKFLRRTPWARRKVELLYLDRDDASKSEDACP